MNRKRVIAIIAAVVCICGLFAFLTTALSKNDKPQMTSDGAVVRENVSIITEDTATQPSKVNDNELIFGSDPHYPNGEIIVSGIINAAPYGFIRRVIETSKDGENYIVKTEPALLTDVFQELHLSKSFALTDGIGQELDANRLNDSAIEPITIVPLNYVPNENDISLYDCASDDKVKLVIRHEFKEEMYEGVTLDGKIELGTWVELNIDITPVSLLKSNIDLSIVGHSSFDSDLNVLFLEKELKNLLGKPLEKTIFEKEFPISIMAGPVPIVIVNEISAGIEADAKISGSIGLNYNLSAETANGFAYSSKTGRLEEIREKNFESDGLQFDTKVKANGEASVAAVTHLLTTLYDSTGLELSVGVEGSADGEVALSLIPDTNGSQLTGSLDLAIGPKIEGELKVEIPIIDNELAHRTLFELQLPPWWEKHWEIAELASKVDTKVDAKVESINLNHTYQTKYGKQYNKRHLTFSFDYSDNWRIAEERIQVESEYVELVNARGASIKFAYYDMEEKWGGSRFASYLGNISKVTESNFIPSNTEKFMVAEIKKEDENGYATYYYAVLPDDDTEYIVINAPSDMSLSFKYYGLVAFAADEPPYKGDSSDLYDGAFTDFEKQEIIAILSSFREVNS